MKYDSRACAFMVETLLIKAAFNAAGLWQSDITSSSKQRKQEQMWAIMFVFSEDFVSFCLMVGWHITTVAKLQTMAAYMLEDEQQSTLLQYDSCVELIGIETDNLIW